MRIFVLLCLLHLSFILAAQEGEAQSNIGLYLSKTTLGHGVSNQHQDLVDRQLLSMVSDGTPMNAKASAFIVKPSLDLIEEGKIEGMDNRRTAKLNLQLKLVYAFTSEVVAVKDVLLVGSGEKSSDAIRKAVVTARKANPSLRKSLAAFRQSAADYITNNCPAFLNHAKEAAGMENYREAFSVLHAVPEEVDCFEQVKAEKIAHYNKWQEVKCGTQLNKARAAQAQNDFSKALGILSSFDASTPCFDEAKLLVELIEEKVDEQQKEEYDWMFKFYAEKNKSETARWNAMNSLFMGWLQESDNFEQLLQPNNK